MNEHCNIKCRFCDYWRLKHYAEELTIEHWQQALLSIKALVGEYFINFSGGEPFLKPGFIDLLKFCHRHSIRSGVTTNGSFLSRETVKRIVAAQPFNLNLSVDAPNAEVHNYLREVPAFFETLSQGIQYLREERLAQGIHFPIMIKPTVNSRNFYLLPQLVQWTQEIGATAVNFQPLDRLTPETYEELWIESEQQADLEKVIEELITLKQAGAPIMNSDQALRLWLSHFREEEAPPKFHPAGLGCAITSFAAMAMSSFVQRRFIRRWAMLSPKVLTRFGLERKPKRSANRPLPATNSACLPLYPQRPLKTRWRWD